jgi:hypothetical protein
MAGKRSASRGLECRLPISIHSTRARRRELPAQKIIPLIAQRLRQAAKKSAEVSSVNSVDDDWLLRVAHQIDCCAVSLAFTLAEIVSPPPNAPARRRPKPWLASRRRRKRKRLP